VPEDRASRDEEIGTCVACDDDRVRVDTPVNLHTRFLGHERAQLLDPLGRAGHERLAGIARVNRHAEHQISPLDSRWGILDRRIGTEGDPDSEPERACQGDRARRIRAHLDMKGHAVPARFGYGLEVSLRLLDHQVAVEHGTPGVHQGRDRDEHDWADGDLGDEVTVPDVEMEDPGAGFDECAELLAEAREVRGIDRRLDFNGVRPVAPAHSVHGNRRRVVLDVTTDTEREKRLAGEAAAALVEDGMTVGLGTGSTVGYFLPPLAARNLDLRCVATSRATETAALEAGLQLVAFDGSFRAAVDLAIDGADQVAPDGWVVKGGGGAHTREKIVAAAADRFVVIISSDKLVERVRPPVPLELLRFGLAAILAELGEARLRDAPATPDGGVLADWVGPVDDPADLAARLAATPGVVEHGLFAPELVSEILIGTGDVVERRGAV
jgi:ribose 5-phosphate isomerase A